MKSIKEIDCRVVRESNGEVSILLGYPMENLVDMFSDMLEEPKDNVRSWLKRELVPLSLKDVERLIQCLTAARNLALLMKTAQDYSVRVVTNDCDCVEVGEAAEIINLIEDECLIIPVAPWVGYPNRWGPEFKDSPCGSCGYNTEGDAMNSDACVYAGCDGSFKAWKPPPEPPTAGLCPNCNSGEVSHHPNDSTIGNRPSWFCNKCKHVWPAAPPTVGDECPRREETDAFHDEGLCRTCKVDPCPFGHDAPPTVGDDPTDWKDEPITEEDAVKGLSKLFGEDVPPTGGDGVEQ